MAINAQLLGLNSVKWPTISVDRLFGGKSSLSTVPWVIGYFAISRRRCASCRAPGDQAWRSEFRRDVIVARWHNGC